MPFALSGKVEARILKVAGGDVVFLPFSVHDNVFSGVLFGPKFGRPVVCMCSGMVACLKLEGCTLTKSILAYYQASDRCDASASTV